MAVAVGRGLRNHPAFAAALQAGSAEVRGICVRAGPTLHAYHLFSAAVCLESLQEPI